MLSHTVKIRSNPCHLCSNENTDNTDEIDKKDL